MKKYAVALGYRMEQNQAPIVLAKGKGVVASQICQIAESHGIPQVRDPVLVSSMEKLEVSKEIPRELYKAIAIIFRELVAVGNQKNN
ncbi:FlhB domain-containing protein [Leptospira ryugenii]|uniref:FlhB domain-containing protein n=1 Tax=Leptospira ryugenii TaxID=1917863 RepID=A0A2P2DWQ2_9LEPT|nr:EscU/YscU/HrcU family type III secretion system export apparatus switch protein [Leptospira ryugenii]GBF49064.1 FlhB domain-containing protein [Leptospira ryugenii]